MDVLDLFSKARSETVQLNSIEHMVAQLYHHAFKNLPRLQEVGSQTDATEDVTVAQAPPVKEASPPELEETRFPTPPREMLEAAAAPIVAAKQTPIYINRTYEVKARDPRQYRKELCSMLTDVANERGSYLVTQSRPDAQVLLLRALVYLNRPAEFINERWGLSRTHFKTFKELNEFMATHRNFIIDFYDYTVTGHIAADAKPPAVRTREELSKPYQRKNVLKAWEKQIVF